MSQVHSDQKKGENQVALWQKYCADCADIQKGNIKNDCIMLYMIATEDGWGDEVLSILKKEIEILYAEGNMALQELDDRYKEAEVTLQEQAERGKRGKRSLDGPPCADMDEFMSAECLGSDSANYSAE